MGSFNAVVVTGRPGNLRPGVSFVFPISFNYELINASVPTKNNETGPTVLALDGSDTPLWWDFYVAHLVIFKAARVVASFLSGWAGDVTC